MNPNAQKVLEALAVPGGYLEPWYYPFKPIMKQTGLDRRTVRRHARYLKRKGFAEFHAGLWNEDGEPAGAGYCITKAGLEYLDRMSEAPR